MPNSLNRESLRTILSDLPSVRTERQRRRVPSGTDEELLAFVGNTFGYRIPDVDCCPEHQAPAQAFCDAYFARNAVAIWKASRGFGKQRFAADGTRTGGLPFRRGHLHCLLTNPLYAGRIRHQRRVYEGVRSLRRSASAFTCRSVPCFRYSA